MILLSLFSLSETLREIYLVAGASVERVPDNLSVDCVDALVVRQALIFTRNIEFFNIVVESDCKKVIDRLNAPWNDHSYFDILIEDYLNFRRDFVAISFVYVCCTTNTVAHNLAALTQVSDIIFSIY